jgi:hypothetical protein
MDEPLQRGPEYREDDFGCPRPSGWPILGLGRRQSLRGVRRSRSVGFDNAFRLVLGGCTGAGLGAQLVLGMPERLEFHTGGVNLPFVEGFAIAFLVAILPASVVAHRAKTRIRFLGSASLVCGCLLAAAWLWIAA